MAGANSETGRIMRQAMVELPARAANRITRVHVAMAIVVAIGIAISGVAGENDPARMLVVLAPDLALWLTSLEIGALLEVAAAAGAALGSIGRLDLVRRGAGFFLRVRNRGGRASRARRSKPRARVSPANDDDDRATVAAAA
ncbi:hypothetical protein [Sphingomonas xinjiangensis]|uniref:Uncharacterized protein n=1 Tax=Sphingomonas xinjiangensis TaxID=643568 RepID=A0A840Y9G2_9SPHN|nr:hypothetical protein [Sphingomonas xinjiangensis]MBB5709977.1 hypothetical protein [Sphingomonas xinjiangensis]